jgi:hypothetical protein
MKAMRTPTESSLNHHMKSVKLDGESLKWSSRFTFMIRRFTSELKSIVLNILAHRDIFFRPVAFYHILKLFQPPSPDSPALLNPDGTPVAPIIDTKKRLVSEFYDEIVFYEPSQMMQQMLNTIQPVTSGQWNHDTDCECNKLNSIQIHLNWHFLSISVEEKKIKSLDQILETRKKVKSEIAQLKEKLQQTRGKIEQYKELAALNTQQWKKNCKTFEWISIHLNEKINQEFYEFPKVPKSKLKKKVRLITFASKAVDKRKAN